MRQPALARRLPQAKMLGGLPNPFGGDSKPKQTDRGFALPSLYSWGGVPEAVGLPFEERKGIITPIGVLPVWFLVGYLGP